MSLLPFPPSLRSLPPPLTPPLPTLPSPLSPHLHLSTSHHSSFPLLPSSLHSSKAHRRSVQSPSAFSNELRVTSSPTAMQTLRSARSASPLVNTSTHVRKKSEPTRPQRPLMYTVHTYSVHGVHDTIGLRVCDGTSSVCTYSTYVASKIFSLFLAGIRRDPLPSFMQQPAENPRFTSLCLQPSL